MLYNLKMRNLKNTYFEGTSLARFPEFGIVIFSFLLHFVWEFLQAPTYTDMATMPHWDGIKVCTSATFGDVGFALIAFWITSAVAKSRQWILRPTLMQVLLFIAVGVALTVGFEYYYTEISLRWTYSDLMPLVPPLGTGLSPLLQWLIIPALVLWFTRFQMQGAQLSRVNNWRYTAKNQRSIMSAWQKCWYPSIWHYINSCL